ncbi:unnamed protein product [Fusarium graminearum]|nr:unnamed protein product [Fusarium graminearum]
MAAGASVIVEPESSPFKSRQEWTAIHVGSEVGVEEFGLKLNNGWPSDGRSETVEVAVRPRVENDVFKGFRRPSTIYDGCV